MNKNEYYSNSYRVIISNKYLHSILSLFEYLLTLTAQLIVYNTNYSLKNSNQIDYFNFHLSLINILNSIPTFSSLIIIIIFYLSIPIYYFIYNKYIFKQVGLFNKIIINIFEMLFFRLFFIILCHIIFLLEGTLSFIFILLSIPVFLILIINIFNNHLYYFSPHFEVYPYDYYSSYIDIIHIIVKALISISLHSSNNTLNEFLFILVFLLQIFCFLFSLYVMKFKSFFFMNNTFMNKSRFSFILSNLLIILLIMIRGKNNGNRTTFAFIIFNIYIISFLIIQLFYNPYKYVFFGNNDNINNIYFYFFIIDHNKNEGFILEQKLEEHYSLCSTCELCYNLKYYLMNKVDYKKIYKILYKDNGILSKIINEIIYVLLANGKTSLKNNSYYLISIIYCYYIYYNKKNYCLSRNLKVIYEIINEENTNILENHLLSIKQISLINEFLTKADNILDTIQEILIEKLFKNKLVKFFSLFKIIFDLKHEKFRTKLYFNKNEGVINFRRYISICTMLYEEIFNITLSGGGISLKENQLFLEDLSNKNNNEMNQIIIELDMLNFESKIICILGEYAKYKGKNLCKLFPNIFRNKQLLIIKKKILNLKYFESKDNESQQNDPTNKVIQKQYIDFQFIINDKEESANKFKMIKLRLNLIYPLQLRKKILLAGIYSIEKNIIITLDKSTKDKNKEYILNLGQNKDLFDFENKTNNNVIKFKKNEKYYNNQKLMFVAKYFINPNIYNIYYVFSQEKQKTFKEDINNPRSNSLKNLFLDEIKNKIDSEQNFNYLIQSTSASTFSQISNNRQNLKKRNKSGNKDNKKRNYFQYYQICLIFFSLLILLFQIICHIFTINQNENSSSQATALMNFKNYYAIFNNLCTSIFALSCLAVESEGEKECSSTYQLYEQQYKKISGKNFTFIRYLFPQYKIYSNQLNGVKHRIIESLSILHSNDLLNLINSPISIYSFSQNISQNGVKLNVYSENISFVDVLDQMTNGFLIMLSEVRYLDEIVYILDKINLEDRKNSPFRHIKLKSQLTQYQNQYYYLILNYRPFVQRLDLISLRIAIASTILGAYGAKLSYIFILISVILYIFFIFILFIYILNYFKLITNILDEMEKK